MSASESPETRAYLQRLKATGLLVCGIAAFGFGANAFMSIEPTDDASPAEVAALLHPSLAFERPHVPDDRNAYLAFTKIGRSIADETHGSLRYKLGRVSWMAEYLSAEDRAKLKSFVAANEPLIDDLRRASEMGPGLVPKRDTGPRPNASTPFERAMVLPLLRAAHACAEQDNAACSTALVDASTILRSIAMVRSYGPELYTARFSQRSLHTLLRLAMTKRKLDAATLRRLIELVPEAERNDEPMAYTVLANLHEGVLPVIGERKKFTENLHGSWGEETVSAGAWEGEENVKKVSALAAEALENLRRPANAQVKTEEKALLAWVAAVPDSISVRGEFPGSLLERAKLKLQMRAVPNALGRYAVKTEVLDTLIIGDWSHRYRTSCEQMRLHLAAAAYELEKGGPATNVEQLIAAGLLKTLPRDYKDGSALAL